MQSMKFTFVALVAAVLMLGATTANAADTYEVDSAHASVAFLIDHLGFSDVFGMFTDVSGSFVLDEENPQNSSIDLTIAAASVNTGNEKRDEHLRSPDFFNVKQFPVITFKSTGIGDGSDNRYEVTGDLTLHGQTNPVTMMVVLNKVGEGPQGGTMAGVSSTFDIDRTDFGMDYGSPNIGDIVTVMVSFEGKQQ